MKKINIDLFFKFSVNMWLFVDSDTYPHIIGNTDVTYTYTHIPLKQVLKESASESLQWKDGP